MKQLEHIYKRINGWCNFEDLYTKAVSDADNDAHFVEIGTYFGKSASFMGVEILKSGKSIVFDTIDTFKGSKNELDKKQKAYNTVDVEKHARHNLKDLPVNIKKGTSLGMCRKYKNNSLDFVFIDGSHQYEDVKKDIKAWLKKVKKGGILAGHDYNNTNVKRAVDELLPDAKPVSATSWIFEV